MWKITLINRISWHQLQTFQECFCWNTSLLSGAVKMDAHDWILLCVCVRTCDNTPQTGSLQPVNYIPSTSRVSEMKGDVCWLDKSSSGAHMTIFWNVIRHLNVLFFWHCRLVKPDWERKIFNLKLLWLWQCVNTFSEIITLFVNVVRFTPDCWWSGSFFIILQVFGLIPLLIP